MEPKGAVIVLLVVTTGLTAGSAGGEVVIQLRGSTVDVRARQVSLHEILDALSARTGMKVVYERDPPRDIVDLELTEATVETAVSRLLCGHGLSYAMRMDQTGANVETLLLLPRGTRPKAALAPPPAAVESPAEPDEMMPDPEVAPPPAETPAPTVAPTPWSPGQMPLPPAGIPGLSSIGQPTPPPTPTAAPTPEPWWPGMEDGAPPPDQIRR
jgi:hypothetical protein